MKQISGVKAILITIGTIILLIFLVFAIQIANYLSKVRESETRHYCLSAAVPEYIECADRYGMEDFKGRYSYYSFETKKYRSLSKLGEALPAGYEEAINAALKSGHRETGTDIKSTPVTIYEVPAESMSLINHGEEPEFESHYCVLEYADRTYRFAVIVEFHGD